MYEKRSALVKVAPGAPLRVPDDVYADAGAGSQILSVLPFSDPGAGLTILPAQYYLLLRPPDPVSAILTAVVVNADSGTGTLIFAGSAAESKTGADSQTGSLIFGGSSTESKTGADSGTGTLIFSGSRVESASFSQTATGTLIFTGTGVDGYSPPAQPFTWVQVGWFVKVS